jgi:hypothetical protein
MPIDFIHTPGPVKPRKTALEAEWENYREAQRTMKVSAVGKRCVDELAEKMGGKKTVVAVDGGFTNSTVFRDIPKNTVFIGRVRKDARLYAAPDKDRIGRGRKRFYGAPLPTPEQIRQDDTVSWQKVSAFGAGRRHDFNVKVISHVRWKGTGDRDVLLIIVRPLSYRRSASSKLLYRQPAYLICTNCELPLEQLLQAYLWRWEVECNFRDEKCVLGVGEAQVRTSHAAKSVPALMVAAYSFLLLAAHLIDARQGSLPLPKWRREKPLERISTQQIIALFRSGLWRLGMEANKRHFVSSLPATRSAFNSSGASSTTGGMLASAVCYAFK